MRKNLLTCMATALLALSAGTTVRAQYSNAVMALNPVAYWPLNETTQPPAAFVATNIGTLGAKANGYYNNPFYGNGHSSQMTLFTGPTTGVTSDGDAAAGFGGGANGDDNSGYVLIPNDSGDLNTPGTPFTAEVWVMPGGGDPNDPSGTSIASTEWAGLIKKGGGGAFYTETGDANGDTYGWTISLAGIYTLGYPDGWYGGVPYTYPVQSQTNACWVVDFYNGGPGNTPSLEFDVPFDEPTPTWFHLVLTFDGTNANFYTNGVLAATTVPGVPQNTNQVFEPNQPPFTTPSGQYAFSQNNGIGYAPDTINPICLGNINESYSLIEQGYPQANAIGFNCQTYNGAMDEAAIYTNALTAAQVAQHYSDARSANTTLYTNDVLSAKPTIYLRFDEPAYTDPLTNAFPIANAYGSMGSAASGLYQPGTIPATVIPNIAGFGPTAYAVQMNGLDAAVDIGDDALGGTPLDPQGHQPFTVAAWFKANPSDCYGRFQTILGRGDTAWRFDLDGSGHVHWNPGNNPEIQNSVNMNDGNWHQIVGVSDGTNATLYIDGQAGGTGGGVGNLNGTAAELLIGGAPDYTTSDKNNSQQRYFAGEVSQVAFFNTNLTASQIHGLYLAADLGPSITQQPQSVVIGQGASGSLTVAASGNPTLAYQWYQGNTKLSDVAGNISGSSTPTLTIQNATAGNGGNYDVVVTNAYGSATSSVAVVTISAAPTILTNPSPASITLYSGNQVTYSVVAVGAPTLAYQWYKNSAAISGATSSSYTVVAVAGTNSYNCSVTNSHGSATSSSVTVTSGAFVPPASGGFTLNFSVGPNSSNPYFGQGAYPDGTNDFWNEVPGSSGTTSGFALSSSSNATLSTFELIYGFNNGAVNSGQQGTPSYLVGTEDAVNGGSPGIGTASNPEGEFFIKNVPQGTYTLYIYGQNYDGNRGSIFTLAPANGGAADGGINSTAGAQSASGTVSLGEGTNYVFFHDVVPDATGTISGTYVPNPNPSLLQGEAPFNGLQLALHLIAVKPAAGGNVTVTWTGGSLYSSTNLLGTWTALTNTSPATLPATGSAQFFKVY